MYLTNKQAMANAQLLDFCRTCTIQTKRSDMIHIFEGSNTADMFVRCTSLEANENDELPAYMCKDCLTLLIGYFNFRLMCTATDAYFRQQILIKIEKNENESINKGSYSQSREHLSKNCDSMVVQEVLPTNETNFLVKSATKAAPTFATLSSKTIQPPPPITQPLSSKIIQQFSRTIQPSPPTTKQSSPKTQSPPASPPLKKITEIAKITDGNCKKEESDGCVDTNEDDSRNDDESYATSSGEESSDNIRIYKKKTLNKKKQSNDVLACSMCPKKFFKKHRLEAHIRQHKGLKPCVCAVCNKEFSKFSGLAQHMNVAHNDNAKSYVCDYVDCNRTYSMRQSLNVHKRKAHSAKPKDQPVEASFMCELCGKSFTTNSSLKKHTYTHTGLMPFKCSLCPKKYATKHKLKEHVMRHEGVKNHICPFCGLRKTTPHELKVHINYHTREKVYPCKLCSAVFSSIGNMSRHVKIVHCGIKAFDCTYCERSFGKAETLKHHIMTHTGEKPHGCEICGKRFIQAIALQTHMKTHTKAARME